MDWFARLRFDDSSETTAVLTLKSSPISLCVLSFFRVICTMSTRVLALIYDNRSRFLLVLVVLVSWPTSKSSLIRIFGVER